MIIKGNRINLRTLRKSDASVIYQEVKNKEISRYIPTIPYPYKPKHAIDFIKLTKQELRKKKSYQLVIELKETKKIIGVMSLSKIDYKNRNAEIGYWIAKKYWHQGYATEAVRLILNFGFTRIKLMRIYARVMHKNTTSSKLLEKLGFKYEGRMRKNTFTRGKWYDDLRYGLLKSEYNKINQ